MTLPIDIMPNRNPVCFRWGYRMSGGGIQHCEGNLPPSVEGAVANLITMTKDLQADNKRLYEEIERLKPQPVAKAKGK